MICDFTSSKSPPHPQGHQEGSVSENAGRVTREWTHEQGVGVGGGRLGLIVPLWRVLEICYDLQQWKFLERPDGVLPLSIRGSIHSVIQVFISGRLSVSHCWVLGIMPPQLETFRSLDVILPWSTSQSA